MNKITIHKTALIAGSSGLVGKALLALLLASNVHDKVTVLVRRPLGFKHPKLDERIIDYTQLPKYEELFAVNEVYCCLGTTIKKARSEKAFKKVDVEYPLQMAELSRMQQVSSFIVISSMGADPASKVFYSRMKGILEMELRTIGLQALHIFRPSLLLGHREEKRIGEKLGTWVSNIIPFVGPLKKYKPIKAETVAKAMYNAAQSKIEGVNIYQNNEISEKWIKS